MKSTSSSEVAFETQTGSVYVQYTVGLRRVSIFYDITILILQYQFFLSGANSTTSFTIERQQTYSSVPLENRISPEDIAWQVGGQRV